MATCIHSSRSCRLPFYTIPIFPLLNRKIFHLLVNTMKYTCVTPICREGFRMIVLVYYSIAKGTSCFHFFLHCASLHPHSLIFTLVTHTFALHIKRSYEHVHVNATPRMI